MAELQFPDIAGRFQQGQQLGIEQRRQRVADERQMAADQQSADDAREKALLNTARMFDAAPDALKPQVLQQIAPRLEQYLPGISQAPIEQVSQGVKAFIASRSGGSAGENKVVGNALVDASGNVVYQAPQRYLTAQGLIEVGPEGAREIRLGEPGGVATAQESDGRPVTISPDLDPATRAAIMANPDAFAALPGQGETVQVPGVMPGQRILPAASVAQEQQMALAREAAARAERADARSAEAAARAQREADIRARFGTIPTGFRVNAEGTALEPAPGGPKPAGTVATEGERKAATLLQRMEGSLSQLQAAVQEDPDASRPSMASEVVRGLPLVGGVAGNAITSPARQRVEAAQLDILDAALTLGTGAAYTREQLEGYRRSYFPQLGDSDATIRDKAARLQNVLAAARTASGRALPQQPQAANRDAPASTAIRRARNPQTGETLILVNNQWVPER